MAAEFAFTQYVSVFGLSNMAGHLLKIASFYLIYLAIIKTAITEPQDLVFRQLETERQAIAEREGELQRQNERLADFASFVSHDLRNPLHIAQGRLELAREDCESEHHTHVSNALERMEKLIGDVLALARAGVTIDDPESIELADIFRMCWANVDTKEATLTIEADLSFQADKSRLQQLLENLIRNAVEHAGQDVSIRVGALENGFYVEDDGPGIPVDDRDEVFEAGFSTAEDGTGGHDSRLVAQS